MRRDFRNILLAVGLLLFFAFTLFFIIPKGIFVPGSIKITVMSPAFFPKTVSIFLMGLSVVLAFQNLFLLRQKKQQKGIDESPSKMGAEDDRRPMWTKALKVFSAIVLLFLYYKTVIWIGILYASVLYLLVFSILYGERRFKITLPLAVALPLAIYLFFTQIAKIPLPKGILFE